MDWFISSTFRDFMYERDFINKYVGPAFRQIAIKNGTDSEIIDFRFGLNTYHLSEEQATKKVVGNCLNSILNTKYLIIFIGDRNGWIPPEKYIPNEFKKIIQVEGKSVTALEIAYGLHDKTTAVRTIICMRKIANDIPNKVKSDYFEQDPELKKRLDSLKDELRKNQKGIIIEYTAEFNAKGELGNFCTTEGKNLADVLIDKMTAICQADWIKYKKASWQELEAAAAWNFIEDRAKRFYARNDLIDDYHNKLTDVGRLFIKGAPGSGKTSIVCKIADKLRKEGQAVCCIFAGSSALSDSALMILQQMVYYLETLLNQPHFKPSDNEKEVYISWQLRFIELDKMIPEGKIIYLLVDAIDMLNSDSHKETLDFLPNYSLNIYYLVTYADDFNFPFSSNNVDEAVSYISEILPGFEADDFQEVSAMINLEQELPLLSPKEISTVLGGILQRHQKELFPATEQAVLEKKPECNKPLYLEIVARAILLIDSTELNDPKLKDNPEKIIDVTVDLVKNKLPADSEKAALYVINDTIKRLCEENLHKEVQNAIEYIAISRHGLRVKDIEKILNLKYRSAAFDKVKYYLSPSFFINRDNEERIDFTHAIIRQSILSSLSREDFEEKQKKLASYLETLPKGDSVRAAESFYLAQKTNNFQFAIDLLDEADETRNPALLQDIYLSLMANNGRWIEELLKNHMTEENFDKFINFFFGAFNRMFNGSEDEYNVAFNLLSALSDSSFKSIEFELMLARMEIRLGKFYDAESRLSSIIRQLDDTPEETLNVLKKDEKFCQNISDVYSQLSTVKLFTHKEDEAQECIESSVNWLNNIENPEKNYLNKTVLNLGQMMTSELKQNSGEYSLEDTLKIYQAVHQNNLDAHNSNPTKLMYLNELVLSSFMLSKTYLDLDNIPEALNYARETVKFADMLFIVDGKDLNSVMTNAVAKLILGTTLLNSKDEQTSIKEIILYLNEALALFMKFHKAAPGEFSQRMIDQTVSLLAFLSSAVEDDVI